MSDEQAGESGRLDGHHKEHRILSGHRCSCGWEGDSPTTHIIDTLGIEQVGRLCSRHGQGCHSRCSEPMEPVYRIVPSACPDPEGGPDLLSKQENQ